MRLKEHIFNDDKNLLRAAKYILDVQTLKAQLAEYGFRLAHPPTEADGNELRFNCKHEFGRAPESSSPQIIQ